jgi:hypothetical protein
MHQAIEKIKDAVDSAEKFESILPQTILDIDGMSGTKTRHFLSNLVEPADVYLEIGTWKGSTLVSALYPSPSSKCKKNFAIDNFSEFSDGNNIRAELEKNVRNNLSDPVNFLCEDSFRINPSSIGISDVSVYFYDGHHHDRSHYLALSHYKNSVRDDFIYIVDDWFCPFQETRNIIQKQTRQAIEDSNFTVLFELEIPSTKKDDRDGWWNGVGIFILSKNYENYIR